MLTKVRQKRGKIYLVPKVQKVFFNRVEGGHGPLTPPHPDAATGSDYIAIVFSVISRL